MTSVFFTVSEPEQEAQYRARERDIRRFDFATDVLFELDIQMPVTEVQRESLVKSIADAGQQVHGALGIAKAQITAQRQIPVVVKAVIRGQFT